MSLRVKGPYNIFLVTDWSIYCHMTRSAMNYLLYNNIACEYHTNKLQLSGNKITDIFLNYAILIINYALLIIKTPI